MLYQQRSRMHGLLANRSSKRIGDDLLYSKLLLLSLPPASYYTHTHPPTIINTLVVVIKLT